MYERVTPRDWHDAKFAQLDQRVVLKRLWDLENQIDKSRSNLKKVARKRLESGADVKTELLYIDLVRSIEKLGDRAFSISEALSQTE